jgi:hypothetical protein
MSPAGLAALLALALVPVGSWLSSFRSILASAFLRPFAPRRCATPLLSYYGRSDLCRARLSAKLRLPASAAPAGFPASCAHPSGHSIPTHLPCPTRLFRHSPLSTGIDLWLRVTQSRLGLRSPLAGSPSTGRRIGFVILRTGRSPPLLPTPESLQRSPFGYRGVNFSRRRTSTALIAPLAGARAPACCRLTPSGASKPATCRHSGLLPLPEGHEVSGRGSN